ncbi:MAG: hypothetical protein WBI82_11010 [Sphaerochaeta sp.]
MADFQPPSGLSLKVCEPWSPGEGDENRYTVSFKDPQNIDSKKQISFLSVFIVEKPIL